MDENFTDPCLIQFVIDLPKIFLHIFTGQDALVCIKSLPKEYNLQKYFIVFYKKISTPASQKLFQSLHKQCCMTDFYFPNFI